MHSNGLWTVYHLAIKQQWLHVCCLVLLQGVYLVTMSTAVVLMSGLPVLRRWLLCWPSLHLSAALMVTVFPLHITICQIPCKVLMACI